MIETGLTLKVYEKNQSKCPIAVVTVKNTTVTRKCKVKGKDRKSELQ